MFQSKFSAADLLKTGHHFKCAQRLGSTELDEFSCRRGISETDRAHLCDIVIRNPTGGARSCPVDPSARIRVVESQSRAEPNFHEPTRLNHREIEVPESILYLLLGIAQRKRDFWTPKGNQDGPSHVGVFGRVHQVQRSGDVDGFNRVPGWRVSVDDAVEITASTPRHAQTIEAASFRSPVVSSIPSDRKPSTFSFELAAQTSALTHHTDKGAGGGRGVRLL